MAEPIGDNDDIEAELTEIEQQLNGLWVLSYMGEGDIPWDPDSYRPCPN